MKEDQDKILQSEDVIVLADKFQNIYKLLPENYKKMIECLYTSYKKCLNKGHQESSNLLSGGLH